MLNNSESQLDFVSLHLVLYVETEQNYVSVFYHIVLAFQTNQTFLTSCGIGAGIQQILVVHNFGANEATFEITVNLTSCLRRFRSLTDCPCAGLLLACGQVADSFRPRSSRNIFFSSSSSSAISCSIWAQITNTWLPSAAANSRTFCT